jgi:hypothetical protein
VPATAAASSRPRSSSAGQPAAVAQRQGEFGDGERQAVGPAGHHRGQRGLRNRSPQAGQHLLHVVVAERAEFDLGQPVIPAQQRPDGAQAMTAGKLVAAVAAGQDDRETVRRVGQGRQQVEARLVRPLEVVEEQHQAVTGRGGQG